MSYQHIINSTSSLAYPRETSPKKHIYDSDAFLGYTAIPLQGINVTTTLQDEVRVASTIPREWHESIKSKLLLIAACLLPFVPSVWLLARASTYTHAPLLVRFVIEDRATTQIIISVVAILLATLNVYVCTRLLNFSTRIALSRHAISLNGLNWFRSISTQKVDAGLPFWLSVAAYGLVIVLSVPAFLWTGALTPVVTTASPKIWNETISTPSYSNHTASFWANKTAVYAGDCLTFKTSKGQLSSCPVQISSSSLLLGAAQATLSKNATITHSKNDASRYSYLGRSYGLGVSAGLVDDKLMSAGVLTYNYTERGYAAEVTCAYNKSAAWGLRLIQYGDTNTGIPYIYFTYGYFPNADAGDLDFFAVPALINDDNLVVLGSKANHGRNIILIAAGANYSNLNATQCEVSFVPTKFHVSVSTVERTIAVTPLRSEGFLDTPGLSNSVMQQLGAISLINTSLYISILGNALKSNIDSNNATDGGDAARFSAIEDSFAAMIDDLLVDIATVQLLVANDTAEAVTQISQSCIVLGDIKYIIAVLVVNSVLVLATMVEGFRTRFWKILPSFDYTNTKSLVIASAIAGNEIVVGALKERSIVKQAWTGSMDQKEYEDEGEIRLRLAKTDVDIDGTRIPAATFSAKINPFG